MFTDAALSAKSFSVAAARSFTSVHIFVIMQRAVWLHAACCWFVFNCGAWAMKKDTRLHVNHQSHMRALNCTATDHLGLGFKGSPPRLQGIGAETVKFFQCYLDTWFWFLLSKLPVCVCWVVILLSRKTLLRLKRQAINYFFNLIELY